MPKKATHRGALFRAWWRKQSGRRRRQLFGRLATAALLLAAAALSIAFGDALWQGPLSPGAPYGAIAPAATSAPLPQAPDLSAAAQPDGTIVWLPWSGGRYHAIPTCSGMQGAFEGTLGEAKALGLTACGRCKPPE